MRIQGAFISTEETERLTTWYRDQAENRGVSLDPEEIEETFVRAAKYLPGIPFVLIGRFKDDAIDHLRVVTGRRTAEA